MDKAKITSFKVSKLSIIKIFSKEKILGV